MKRPQYNRAKLQRIPLDALLEIAASMLKRHTEGHGALVDELEMRAQHGIMLRREELLPTQRFRSECRLWGVK